jgi:hypothetical protein
MGKKGENSEKNNDGKDFFFLKIQVLNKKY